MNRITSDVLVVGAGPAGLAAAVAASERSKVMIVDDNHAPGGQIWRADRGKANPAASKLLSGFKLENVTVLNGAAVFERTGPTLLVAETPAGRLEVEFEKLIIATGARERFLPFPGWTLPNVMGAGGLQALVKGGMDVRGKRIVVAGTGPLLLAVADYLKAKGAEVLLIAEQAPTARVNRFALGLWRSPGKIAQAVALRRRLLGTPYLTDCWLTSAHGDRRVESVQLTHNGKTRSVACDLVACGFHLVPSTELAVMLGCEIVDGKVAVDDLQETTVENIYCAGEPTGIGGVEASLVEGTIAGLAATGRAADAQTHFNNWAKAHKFADALNRAFTLRDELKTLARPDTIVCRCEDVEYRSLAEFDNSREAKLQTRCGMGPCQGRICGAATEFLFGWQPGTVRAPLFPVKMEDL